MEEREEAAVGERAKAVNGRKQGVKEGDGIIILIMIIATATIIMPLPKPHYYHCAPPYNYYY